MKYSVLLSLMLFFFQEHSYGQVDSKAGVLNQRVAKSLESFKKIRNPNKVLLSLDSLGNLSQIQSDSLRAAVFYYKGSALGQLNKFDSSLVYLQRSFDLIKDKDYAELEVFTYMAFGNVFWAREYISLALEYYQKGLDICALQSDSGYRQLETLLLNNTAGVYARMEDFESALLFALKANANLLKTDPTGKAPRNYLKLGTYLNALKRPAEAMEKLAIGEKQAVELGDSIALAHILDALAVSYNGMGDWENSERYATRSLDVSNSLNYKFASPYFSLAAVFNAKRLFDKAKENNGIGSALADELHDVLEKKKAVDLAYQIALNEEDFPAAVAYLSQVNALNDSIRSIARNKQVEEIQIRYETEKKEQQIKQLEQANALKDLEADSARQRQISLVIVLVLAIALAVILFNRYQLKQRTAKALDEKNIELEKLNGFKDKMFAVISHDLRNPVDAFSTLMESLNQNLQHASQEELKEYLQSMLVSAKDLKSLLNNLLEWSLVQIGKLPFNPKPFSINEAIRESAQHISSMAIAKQIQMIYPSGDAAVRGDRNMITIIIRNLLSNAVKFSDAGKAIVLDISRSQGRLIVLVKDEGIGMSANDVAKLFKQNENVRSIGSSSAKGAGIGLLLCQELVEKNGGKIYAESVEGKGSTFYLELPLA